MRRISRFLLGGSLVCLVCCVMAGSLRSADLQLNTEFEGNEPIETLTLKIAIGAGGEDLAEPVALDLGLGFPLWLHPVGRTPSEVAPFGAVQQQSMASNTLAAGSSASFTFHLKGNPGDDKLYATSQLLAGVQVSDIARIGFASQGTTSWLLEGYEITINGRPFAANADVNQSVRVIQDTARFRLAELAVDIAPRRSEARDLRALADALLASAPDLERLAVVENALNPLLTEKRRLEGQTRGIYPWFEEPEFRSPWRTDSSVKSVRVTLMTQTHSGADTENYVYFRTGGHKYLLSSRANPLSGRHGAQRFEVDLIAGPFTAADSRGYAVGMLGHGFPYAHAPDRWHP